MNEKMSYENDSIVISGSEDNDDDRSISDSSLDTVHYNGNYVGQRVLLVPTDDNNPWRFDSWTVDEIIEYESEFRDGDKIDTFFRYSYYDVWNYLCEYDEMEFAYYFRNAPDGGLIYHRPKINIMKLNIMPCGAYSVSIKTHWIRLIQRHWRSTLFKRNQMLRQRRSPPSVRYREIHGKYPINLRNLPGLYGMLSVYS